ncbi:Uncharacterised protein [Burkholderia pseudomallei]|uniref:hypothetical protein n=1 Tax=Burkholderia pseudomallei TaxID=28450 RepID=UPI000975473A|nr:hypothetical protein [Burkholderia pseudomallei]CAJ3063197.1 Uncharacterised protein [Burkholderia pseudomallei]CAJ3071326.1 Uncharacterised protein [Burkholderia pseudomallei]CAJ3706735.1 Uncharacterised protein [Burkholderia pseudomallei]CAJ3726135.1 Uncharacterised protein [Burkholderia pseudomallei]CAJ4727497.1 Uncharacterised protein [Burkholderia pseudomallei]
MKIPIPHSPSSLARHQPVNMDVEAAKRDGWQRQRILVVAEHDERLDFVERELVRRIGNRLYGSPGQRGHHG